MGACISLMLPPTLEIVTSLLVEDTDQTFAIPNSIVTEIVWIIKTEMKILSSFRAIVLRGRVLPLMHLHELLKIQSGEEPKNLEVLVTLGGNHDQKVGLVIDSVIRQQEIMIKLLTETKINAKGYSGFTLLEDG
ncbi:MAG: chemotaxis protein CheW [archaeon]